MILLFCYQLFHVKVGLCEGLVHFYSVFLLATLLVEFQSLLLSEPALS